MDDKIIENRPYRHFKGKLYFVHAVTENTETGELFVSYQAMYPPYNMYMRSLKAFTESVSVDRCDNVTKQSKRFILYDGKMKLY